MYRVFNSIVMLFSSAKAIKKHSRILVNKSESHDCFVFRLIIQNISLLVCRLRTVIDIQVFPFIVFFLVTKHEVQTAALIKHKSRVKIYQCEEDNYQTTEVIRHTHSLNFACKLKWPLNQVAVKPAVRFKNVPV
jgi:hypothetical protein